MKLIYADRLEAEYKESYMNNTHQIEGADRIHNQEHWHILHILNKQPAVEAEPVRHGHWIYPDTECGTIACICSECGWESHYYEDDVSGMPYCPNCGAKMEG